MLKGEVSAGERVKMGYDPVRKGLRIDKAGAPASENEAETGVGEPSAAEAATV